VPYVHRDGRTTLKMLRSKSKTLFVKEERYTQNAIALLNYLKRIVPQQLMLKTQVFTQKIFKRNFLNKNVTFRMISIVYKIRS
jgi:hypothetical protein